MTTEIILRCTLAYSQPIEQLFPKTGHSATVIFQIWYTLNNSESYKVPASKTDQFKTLSLWKPPVI